MQTSLIFLSFYSINWPSRFLISNLNLHKYLSTHILQVEKMEKLMTYFKSSCGNLRWALLKSHMTIFNLHVCLCVKRDVLKIHKRMFTDPPLYKHSLGPYADFFFALIEFLFACNYWNKKRLMGNDFFFFIKWLMAKIFAANIFKYTFNDYFVERKKGERKLRKIVS